MRGSYDATWEMCQRACDRYGWYNRNAAVNPSLVEGKKTGGLEIAEQCGDEVPDWVAVSVGDGCTIAGIGKGLAEMKALGFIPRLPRLLGVQAQGARPLVDAFARRPRPRARPGRDARRQHLRRPPPQLAEGPAAVRESGGAFVAVPDEAILDASARRADAPGLFGEPAAVAAVAGLRQAVADGIVGRRRLGPRRAHRQRPEGRALRAARRRASR